MVQSISGGQNPFKTKDVEKTDKSNEVENKSAVPSEAEAEAKEVTAEGNDESNLSYSINDESGEVNEAEQLAEQMRNEHRGTISMVKEFTNICNTQNDSLINNLNELSNMVSYVTVTETQTDDLNVQIAEEEADLQEVAEDVTQEIEEKEQEIDELNDKIEDGTATEEEQAKAEELGEEINEAVSDGNEKIQAKQKTVDSAKESVVKLDSDTASVAQKIGKSINDAGNAKEYAVKTNELSKDLFKKGLIAYGVGSAFGVLGIGAIAAGAVLMSKAKQGMVAADKLNASASATQAISEKIAQQNDININKTNAVDVSSTELDTDIDTTVIEGDNSVAKDGDAKKADESKADVKSADVPADSDADKNDDNEKKKVV